MSEPRRFDTELYQRLNSASRACVENLLSELRGQMDLKTAADIGCGLGYFSGFLHSLGFQVTAVDGREENANEGRRRYPDVKFITANAEDLPLVGIQTYDLVLCFGLLYHLENPFRAIRHLSTITSKVLLVESMCAPGIEPSLQLLDEYYGEDQGLNYVAFYPTESCLVKMLYQAGFPFVYGFSSPPDLPFYHGGRWRKKERTMLVASKEPLNATALVQLQEPMRPWDIWSIQPGPWRMRLDRVARLVRKFAPQAWPNSKVARKT